MNRFVVPLELLTGEVVALPAPVSRQLSRVLRFRPGAQVVLLGGDGSEWSAVLTALDGDRGEARLLERSTPQVELPGSLHVGVAVLKGEKLDWTIQKLAELGATQISLLQTERTIVSAGEQRWPKRFERYAAIVREAVEQSGRVRLPELAGPFRLSEWLKRYAEGGPILLSPAAQESLQQRVRKSQGSCLIAIGPEGGFSPGEMENAASLGARFASLGKRVLRAETAAIAATAVAAAAMEGETIS
jgi:16S rRNA (uracil1498-N3)-methyltransferase